MNRDVAKHEVFIRNDVVLWQSDTAKTYRCPVCQRSVFTQYEGDDSPTIACEGDGHRLQWDHA